MPKRKQVLPQRSEDQGGELQLYHAKAETFLMRHNMHRSRKLQLYHAKAETCKQGYLLTAHKLQLYHAKAETLACLSRDVGFGYVATLPCQSGNTSKLPAVPEVLPCCNFTMPKRKLTWSWESQYLDWVATLPCQSGNPRKLATLPGLSNYIKYTTLFSFLQIKFNL